MFFTSLALCIKEEYIIYPKGGRIGFDSKKVTPVASRGPSWLASLKIRLKTINADQELAMAA